MTTPIREEPIGKIAVFLIPSLKAKRRDKSGATLEDRIHHYLLKEFGGYTAAAGNIFGYWKDDSGKEFYGEHREYKVGLRDDTRIHELKRFLAELARDLEEECLYLEAGKDATFVYGTGSIKGS